MLTNLIDRRMMKKGENIIIDFIREVSMKSGIKTRDVASLILEQERNAQRKYREMMEKTQSLEERAILRDVLLQKEMNELLIKNMYNL